MHAPMTALTLRLTHPCARCSRPLPVRTISGTASCVTCGHTTTLSGATWASLAPRAEVAARLLGDTEDTPDTPLSRRVPECRSCSRPVPLGDLPAAVPTGGLRCTCGERVPVRSSDALTRQLVPGALYIVNEHPPAAAASPILFACMGCGSAMSADGRRRVEDCGRCKAANYLPDALWSVLHPVEEQAAISVVGRLLPEEIMALRLESPAACAVLAASDSLDSALWPSLAAHEAPAVRAALAANPVVPDGLRATLAEDPEPDVRAALAGCRAAHPRLLLDASAAVRTALAASPTATPETLARLAEDPDPGVRRAVASAKATPEKALCAMGALESDEPVLMALLARESLPSEVVSALASPQQTARIARRLAARPKLPDAAASRLAGHYEDAVRQTLLTRSDLPERTLQILATDSDPAIRRDARAHPDFLRVRRQRRRFTLMVSSAVILVSGASGLLGAALLALRFSDDLMRMMP